ncbi:MULTISPECIES: DUF1190 family protein [Photobacterium]|uniref:Lipoprotein n=1 Tax=Photobacterium ganghwense TaxID=320778 RepID=A0A0J1HDV3_9GAMM|nr:MULTISPECIES: DUF1190 family protein [Photobacterium]KLV09816.1 hypothetical protein ABT57_09005 [Photobacterium ganghwense]MBV1839623.1 DUF1190 family protein [Photobacterium ganghwense]PSU09346.1 DUF1190 domain-containing protein [Photobacterium ganghwense]QSV16534.1 DUF1190 family protein [Photobacterium ganghwense]
MKRSKNVVLASMRKNWRPASAVPVTVAFASFALSGCSDNGQEATIYETLKDCESDNPSYTQECKAAYQNALDEAARTAPKYNSRYDCESEFGANACVQSQSNNWFMPAMAGFMFGRMMDRDRGYYSQPMFSSYYPGSTFYNRWTTADGYDYGNSRYKKSKVIVSRDHMKPKPTVTRTISRGGFGSTVAAKSSWSSSSRSSGSWGG